MFIIDMPGKLLLQCARNAVQCTAMHLRPPRIAHSLLPMSELPCCPSVRDCPWQLHSVLRLGPHTNPRGCELPTFPPYDAFEDLVRAFKGRWGSHAAECVDDVAAAVQRRAAAVAAELFGRFPRAHNAVG